MLNPFASFSLKSPAKNVGVLGPNGGTQTAILEGGFNDAYLDGPRVWLGFFQACPKSASSELVLDAGA